MLAQIAKTLVSPYFKVFASQKVLADSSPEPFLLSAGLLGWTKGAGWDIIEHRHIPAGIYSMSSGLGLWTKLKKPVF